MATQTLVVVSSDLSGEPEATTVKVGLLGTEYELDLTAGELEELEAVLAPYLTVARRVGGRRSAPARVRGGQPTDMRPGGAQARTGASSKIIREWARGQGYELPDRGRVPKSVQDAFLAAQNDGSKNGGAKVAKAAAPEPKPEPAPEKPARRRRTKAATD